ncbi:MULTISPECIES: hypothetical protein [unclassified Endozoicomonas]|uniref:hypothetical protein n=1 Tax=unclassified Endozoicomonas TaxID=2644528 RepID=UPI003BB49251
MNLERLLVWQEAVELYTKVILSFKYCRDFGFKDQITCSSTIISDLFAKATVANITYKVASKELPGNNFPIFIA